MQGLEGKVAIVTGAARYRGIGRAIAMRLAEDGADIVAVGSPRAPEDFPESERAINWLGVTSVAAVPLVVFLIVFVLCHLGTERAALAASVRHPLIAVALALSLLTILWHMQLGMRVVIEDYVHGAMRLPCLLANSFFTVALGAVALYAILSLSLGA